MPFADPYFVPARLSPELEAAFQRAREENAASLKRCREAGRRMFAKPDRSFMEEELDATPDR
jgi:hypothetical protein